MKLKFWDKSKWMTGSIALMSIINLRVSSFMLAFLKLRTLTFSIDLL